MKKYFANQCNSTGINPLKEFSNRIYLTEEAQEELKIKGWTVIKQVLDIDILAEIIDYIELKQESESILKDAYLSLSRAAHNVGLVTKEGWTKFDYAGRVQQILSIDPNLYTLAAELYQTTRLTTNFYEYKYNYGREESCRKNCFEFVHAGKTFLSFKSIYIYRL